MRKSPYLWLLHVPLLLVGATMLLPFLFMLATSLAEPGRAIPATDNFLELIWPRDWHWGNYATVWEVVPFGRYYCNSVFVAVFVTFGKVATSALAAYAFARLKWKGRDTLFFLYLATLMVPSTVTMIPNFILIKSMPELLDAYLPIIDWSAQRYIWIGGLEYPIGRLLGLDSYFALIVPAMFTAYGTFLLRQFFLTLPGELDEAAKIDGCSHWQIFWHVILPLSLPSLSTLSILTFMSTWGAFIWPLVVTNTDDMRVLPVGLQAFQGEYGTEWHLMMAAAILMLLPNILIFLFGQRYFLSGLTVGAVKG